MKLINIHNDCLPAAKDYAAYLLDLYTNHRHVLKNESSGFWRFKDKVFGCVTYFELIDGVEDEKKVSSFACFHRKSAYVKGVDDPVLKLLNERDMSGVVVEAFNYFSLSSFDALALVPLYLLASKRYIVISSHLHDGCDSAVWAYLDKKKVRVETLEYTDMDAYSSDQVRFTTIPK